MIRARRGQSILEYVIVFAVIIAAILAIAKLSIKPAVEEGYKQAGTAMTNAAKKISTQPFAK
ncbi:MAG: hypothetical protein COV72_05715 [Candidatus Omnitrophica bacterium CG11_big_fil_rev_8_21_14_0_20_42_13]|uniref:Uncharacterized protein n=1 Tax=Candidatus Ghiorseimicrobium undicola TaxID=1974746 RepID=A0A2H0LWZ3_9BACT|nr:MAG: hypothetical protein COV72_05715 [Candidatus Omnitrophica bacterium CG11_big_fil_rev_8_21_14_0_20_42_13]